MNPTAKNLSWFKLIQHIGFQRNSRALSGASWFGTCFPVSIQPSYKPIDLLETKYKSYVFLFKTFLGIWKSWCSPAKSHISYSSLDCWSKTMFLLVNLKGGSQTCTSKIFKHMNSGKIPFSHVPNQIPGIPVKSRFCLYQKARFGWKISISLRLWTSPVSDCHQ